MDGKLVQVSGGNDWVDFTVIGGASCADVIGLAFDAGFGESPFVSFAVGGGTIQGRVASGHNGTDIARRIADRAGLGGEPVLKVLA